MEITNGKAVSSSAAAHLWKNNNNTQIEDQFPFFDFIHVP